MRAERDAWIGEMRRLLARSSLSALEPDIVILDEFQRFKYLLDESDPVALLAQQVFNFPDVKVLLLSATPYKMYSLAWELQDDHYQDFYNTSRFLLRGDEAALAELREGVSAFREAYLHAGAGGAASIDQPKAQIERTLRRIMVRTERLASTADRNGMLREEPLAQDSLTPRDFRAFRHFDRIAQHIDAGDQVEFWKSTSYPLNLMEGYKVKQQLKSALENDDAASLDPLLAAARDHLLQWKDVRNYVRIDPDNARLRALLRESVETGNWQLLWMPASLPYYRSGRAFKEVGDAGRTKSLVFSAWRVVPKAIAVLASYEAERRILEREARDFSYADLTRKRRPLLNFARSKDRLVGMPVFTLTYPCWTLAHKVDPLQIGLALGRGSVPSERAVFQRARQIVGRLLSEALAGWRVEKAARVDDRWYWAAPAILDWHGHRPLLEAWFRAEEPTQQWEHMLDEESRGDAETRFVEHVREFQEFLPEWRTLGTQPADLLDVLARIALAGPATVSLRAMLRVAAPKSREDQVAFLAGAASAGLGFRTLFNQPLSISTLNQVFKSGAYWAKVLKYAQAGNLQAVMDEYVHVLNESLGLMGHAPGERAEKIAEAISTATSLRTPSLGFDEIAKGGNGRYTLKLRRVRCRYALRFGDEKSEGVEEVTRSADVRVAFNSPFRPFILATTSIGQEGLDFHQYCHRVVHWNLPSNPVDLEQREGRVHRYKGHVIRRNLAKRYGLTALPRAANRLIDPWKHLFERACHDRPADANDLEPYWIFDTKDGYKIERQIPLLPLSREIGQLAWLKKTLVAYRSVIGQPRQEELIEFMLGRLTEKELEEFSSRCAIDLSPRRSDTHRSES
jgi:hypothetical protein